MATTFETKLERLVHALSTSGYFDPSVKYGLPGPRDTKAQGISRNTYGWQAQLSAGGRPRYLGTFATKAEAERAYDRACQVLWRKAFETDSATQRHNYTPHLQVLAFGATL